MAVYLGSELRFPAVDTADEWGFLAVGGDLSTERLLLAYRSGIFPWGGDPVRWYSPDPRCVMRLPGSAQWLPRRLLRTVRSAKFEIRWNTAFDRVIRACARPAPGREETWLTPPMIEAYDRLHDEGVAHSVETWQDDELVGGLYGIGMGGMFSGESMFHRARDASKVAYAHLLERLERRGYLLLDCQVPSVHLIRLGATIVSRAEYLAWLREALERPCTFDTDY